VKSMTYVLIDQDYLPVDYALSIRAKADRAKNLIRGLISFLQTHPHD